MQRVLHEKLEGLYLYGSLATGDFDLDISDLDFLATTSSGVTATELEALRLMHQSFAADNPDWDNRVDVVYLSVKALRTFRSAKSPIVISPGEPLHVREGEALVSWLQTWYLIREGGVALFGPPPKTIIPPIAQSEFAQSVRDYASELSEKLDEERSRKYQAYIILTMCRALHVHRTGKQASKRQAALWAQEALPEWSGLIRSALAWRQAWREENVDPSATRAETLRFVNFAHSLLLR